MPNKPLKHCAKPGCNNLTHNRLCDIHEKKETRDYDLARDKKDNRKFLHSWAWRKERDAYLSKQPLCERCLKNGLDVPAYLVHHKDRNELNRVEENKEALCNVCHELEHKHDRFRKK